MVPWSYDLIIWSFSREFWPGVGVDGVKFSSRVEPDKLQFWWTCSSVKFIREAHSEFQSEELLSSLQPHMRTR